MRCQKICAMLREVGSRGSGATGAGLAVLLELADSLALSPEQVNQVRVISQGLQEKLDQRRASLGRRFDNVRPGEQGRLFAEIQPEIQRSRAEIMDALRAVEAVLTAEQWERLPEAIRNPFRTGARGQERQRVR
jgi:hypothetical protein